MLAFYLHYCTGTLFVFNWVGYTNSLHLLRETLWTCRNKILAGCIPFTSTNQHHQNME